jgi:integrase
MPSFTPTKSGNGWECRWYSGGQRRSKTLYGRWKAVEAEGYALEAADAGRPNSGPLTMADVLTLWEHQGGNRESPLSDKGVASRNRARTIPRLGHIRVEKVTHLTLEAFYRQMGEQGLSAGYIHNIHWDISGALNIAVRNGYIPENPAEKVHFGRRQERPEIVPPSVEDLTALLAHLDAKPSQTWAELALAVRIGIVTGARIGEICGLRWEDIDHEVPCISIVRNVVAVPGGAVDVRATKTKVRRRAVIHEALVARLEAHRLAWAQGGTSGPLLFSSAGHLSPGTLGSRFKIARKEAGLSFRFHDLRHFAVSTWLTEMPMYDVSRYAGHRQVATTTDTYGHQVNAEVDRRAIEAIARRIDI